MKRFLRRIGPLIAVLILLVSAGCGDSSGKVDENIKNIQIESQKFEQGRTAVDLPVITGMKDERLQKKINENLKTAILAMERKGEQSSLEGEYRIVFLNDRLLVIAVGAQNYNEDENGNTRGVKGLHIDLTSGKIYEPTEMFKKDGKYAEEILKLAKTSPEFQLYDSSNENWQYELFKSNWDSKKQKQFYMLTREYLWVYTFLSDDDGYVPGYAIPYDKIKYLIDTDSNLWKAFSSSESRAQELNDFITLPEYQVAVDERAAREAANQEMQERKKAVAAKKPAISWKTANVVDNHNGTITINGHYVNTTDKTMTKTNWNKLTIYYKTGSGQEKSFVRNVDKATEKEVPPGKTATAWFRVKVPEDYQTFVKVKHQFNYSYTYSN